MLISPSACAAVMSSAIPPRSAAVVAAAAAPYSEPSTGGGSGPHPTTHSRTLNAAAHTTPAGVERSPVARIPPPWLRALRGVRAALSPPVPLPYPSLH